MTRSGLVAPTLPASGDGRTGSVMPDVCPSHLRQVACSSQKPLILFFAFACHVTRPLTFSHVRSEKLGRLSSFAYSHLVASPAFWLKYRPAFGRLVPWVRAFTKYQIRSSLMGPPTA